MATYHCKLNKGKCSYALKHANYILREGKYSAERSGREDLIYKESGNLPDWALSAQHFWKAADQYERSNGVVYFEFELALPNELTQEQNIEIVHEVLAKMVGQDKPYTFAIHDKPAALKEGVRQPHAHIMFSERPLDREIKRDKRKYFSRPNSKHPERGGVKKDTRFTGYKGRENIILMRKRFEDILNKKYKDNGFNIRVSSDSLKNQYEKAIEEKDFKTAEKLNREAEKHLGPKLVEKIKKGEKKYQDKSEYYFNEAMDKVLKNFLLRKAKEIALEREKLQKEISELTVQQTNNDNALNIFEKLKTENREKVKVISFEISKLMNRQLEILKQQRKDVSDKKKEIQKKIMTDTGIRVYVRSVYTKSASSKLAKDYQFINAEKEKCLKAIEKLEASKPSIINVLAYKEYKNKLQDLLERQNKINNQKNKVEEQIQNLKEKLAQPEAKAKRAEMIQAMQSKVKVQKEQVELYNKNINILDNQIVLLSRLKQDIDNLKTEIILERQTYANLQNQNITSMKNTINQLRYAINKARDNKSGSMRAAGFLGKKYEETNKEEGLEK